VVRDWCGVWHWLYRVPLARSHRPHTREPRLETGGRLMGVVGTMPAGAGTVSNMR